MEAQGEGHGTQAASSSRAGAPVQRPTRVPTRSMALLPLSPQEPLPPRPRACSTPGSSFLHCIRELAQTHVHRAGDAIQPSHPLPSPPPAPIRPSIRVFSSESALHLRWPKCCSFSFSISPSNEHPGLISFRMDWLELLAVQGTLKSSPAPQFKSINSSALTSLDII